MHYNTLRGLGSADFFVWDGVLGVLVGSLMRLMNLGSLGKLVSSVLIKFLKLSNLFTLPLPQKQPQPPHSCGY